MQHWSLVADCRRFLLSPTLDAVANVDDDECFKNVAVAADFEGKKTRYQSSKASRTEMLCCSDTMKAMS